MIRIIGKVSVFVDEKDTNNGKIINYSTSYDFDSGKDTPKEKIYLDVRFGSKNFGKARLAKWQPGHFYVIDVTDGWLSGRSYGDGKAHRKVPTLFINDGKPVTSGEYQRKEQSPKKESEKANTLELTPEDLPF